MISHVVWDWNGTLFDDVQVSFDVANQLLDDFNLPRLASVEHYRQTFGFPIVEYYRRLGFDVGPGGNFEAGAARYIQLYSEAAPACSLAPGALATVRALHEIGVQQVVISASQQGHLQAQLAPFGLTGWLDEVLGLDNIYAASKEAIVRAWLTRSAAAPRQVLFVGDSEHDAEIADAVGASCALVAHGHHGRARLSRFSVPIIDHLDEVLALVADRRA